MKNRKTYLKEFKLGVIALVKDQNYAVAEEAENEDGHAFRRNGKLTQIRKHKVQVMRWEIDLEILKKAMFYFAKETN